ncbi:hypothetical protein XANCAGTX0491_007159 [Xanthoria calcicola]
MSPSLPNRPRVFIEAQSGSDFLGRITIELFSDKTPKTAENFRAICTPPTSAQPLTYKGARFHRIIDEFMIQGGDITAGNGTGGMSIYGPVVEDENIGWREIDAIGLVCMANRGKGTNSSQFFITLAPCQHLNAKHTVFGRVIKGMDVCERMAKAPVDSDDRPLSEIVVSHCGELQPKLRSNEDYPFRIKGRDSERSQTWESRDAAAKGPISRPARSSNNSPSPSRHRRHRERSLPPRRRSDAGLDENRRGRTATRSVSPHDHSSRSPRPKHRHRRRSSPPSRSRSPKRSRSPHLRRRSTDRDRPPRFVGTKPEGRDQMEWVRWNRQAHRYKSSPHGDNGYGSRQHPEHRHGRLDKNGLDGGGGYGIGDKEDHGVKFKGRGSMKYQEPNAW